MTTYRIKHGSHVHGTGTNTVKVRWSDPEPFIESDVDLCEMMPEKFEYYNGPKAQFTGFGKMTTDEARKRADQLREQADELERQAVFEERQLQAQAKAAKTAKAATKGATNKAPSGKSQVKVTTSLHGIQDEPQGDESETQEPNQTEGDEEVENTSELADDLDTKTIPQLRQIASVEKISLGAAVKKDDIVSLIRNARAGE